MPGALKLFLHRLQLLILQLMISVMSGRKPILLAGPGSAARLCATVVELGARRVLIVTDAVLVKIGLIAPLVQALEAAGAACAVYDGVEPDPTHAQIEAGVALAREHRADAVLAVGGGSPMDAAKVIAACVGNNCRVADVVGNFKVKKAPLPVYAVPTTAGTGSEVTAVAVVTDTAARAKTPVVDGKLVPVMAALDAVADDRVAARGHRGHRHGRADARGRVLHLGLCQRRDASALGGRGAPDLRQPRQGVRQRRRSRGAPGHGAGLVPTRASRSRAPASATCTRSRTTSAACTARRTGWPTRSCCRTCSIFRAMRRRGNSRSWRWRSARRRPPSRSPCARSASSTGCARWHARPAFPRRSTALRAADIPVIARRAMDEAQGFYPVPRFMVQSECEALLAKLLP